MKRIKRHNPFLLEHEIDDTRLDSKIQGLWTENTFLDTRGKAMKSDATSSGEHFIGKAMTPRRIFIVEGIFFLSLFLVLSRVFFLQVTQGKEYSSVAEHNRIRLKVERALRGIIVDRAGEPLTENIPSFSLTVIPSDLPKTSEEKTNIITALADLLHESPETLRNDIDALPSFGYDPVPLRTHLSYEAALQIKIASSRLAGIALDVDPIRRYRFMDDVQSVSHILGYVGKITQEEWPEKRTRGYLLSESVGKTGIEFSYEEALRGKHGRQEIEVNALGKEKHTLVHEKPENGKTVWLTIDLALQRQLEKNLRDVLQQFKKKRGAAILLEPKTGAIRAFVNIPSFNANDFVIPQKEKVERIFADPDQPLFNRIIAGQYPPGSVIKPIYATLALEQKRITPGTSFFSAGGLRVGQWFFPDWKAGGHGATNVVKAIAESVNTFFYIIAGGYNDVPGLGVELLMQAAARFGLGGTTGIDLPGEKGGFLPTEQWKQETFGEQWYIGDTYHLAIGQGYLSVTPLQLATAMAVFANGGYRITPHLVEAFGDEQGKTLNTYREPVRVINDEDALSTVRRGLKQTTLTGSVARFSALPVPTAGKTGTAQWGGGPPHAWFSGFAPYENPEFVITVLVEEGEEGSRTAATVAYNFFQWYFSSK